MKKSILTTLLIYSSAILLLATNPVSAQEVISSAGESLENSSAQLDFTVGQISIETYSEGSIVLTQGFHQTFEEIITGLNLTSSTIEATVYPNPATNFIKLSTINAPNSITFQLYDINGAVVKSGEFMDDHELSLKAYAKGLYLLLLFDDEKDLIQSFKIQVK